MPTEKKEKEKQNEDLYSLQGQISELKQEVKGIEKRLEGHLTLPLFGRIAVAFFGILLSLWSLVWFSLRTYIRSELLEYKHLQETQRYENSLEIQVIKRCLERLGNNER